MNKKILLVVLVILGPMMQELLAQKATIREEKLNMKTYMFSDPSPVPQVGRLYPYFRFDGYTDKGEDQLWNMVILENDYIKVYVCPDIGGKVWGAIEKSTGKEFLYFNHVVKFRDIAMRGAWTSGGLEYNFGDIGHIPTCATPVDYRIKENDDGSVSCIVGALYLPSRTNWNVEIKLEKDKAYFETKATWFNNTALPVTYYHWMNAAAKADGNLEFLYPGDKSIGHGGEVSDWSEQNGRDLKFYEQNNFGPSKSYHVMNGYADYFGGYYHDDDFGFGHYSSYDDKPGKKIWIWGLSEAGMIWEDLLTDSDGQYIEYQSGKLFNQAGDGSTRTPFKHREFSPHDTDVMSELWFPLKETKGMVAASKYGVLNVERSGDKATVFVSPLQRLSEELIVSSKGQTIKTFQVDKSPLDLFSATFDVQGDDDFKIVLGDHKITFDSEDPQNAVDRPVNPNMDFDWESANGLYIEGLELEKQRKYPEALEVYKEGHKKDPGFSPTLNRLAMSYYRVMNYKKALSYANRSLAIDTYDALANYSSGLIHAALGNTAESKSAFSIASHSMAYRSASYTELAKLFLNEHNLSYTNLYLKKALAFNKYNIQALEMLAVIHRLENKTEKAKVILKKLDALDASNSFLISEQLFLGLGKADFTSLITNELPDETYLELAMKYLSFGGDQEALTVLKLAPETPIVLLWLAQLDEKNATINMEKALAMSAEMVFPHRVESVEMLQSAIENNPHWKLKYYLSLIYWNKGLLDQAQELLQQCKNDPDEVIFYLTKAEMFSDDDSIIDQSLSRALEINSSNWRLNMTVMERELSKENFEAARKLSRKYMKLYPDNSRFGMNYARSLMGLEAFEKCISFLKDLNVLPYEHATYGRVIYHKAGIKASYRELERGNYKKAITFAELAKAWPRNLGVGRPYDVDERLDDYIRALAYEKMGEMEKAKELYRTVANYDKPAHAKRNSKLLLQLWALKKVDKEDEANALLNEISAKNEKNVYFQWVKAKYSNENSESLKNSILNSNIVVGIYDSAFRDSEFKILTELVDIIEASN
jgi:tetratricopeptide (TPR) repeat protein